MTTKKKKKAPTKKVAAKPETSLHLEMEGCVYVVERDAKNNIISQGALDSKAVLDCLLIALKKGLER